MGPEPKSSWTDEEEILTQQSLMLDIIGVNNDRWPISSFFVGNSPFLSSSKQPACCTDECLLTKVGGNQNAEHQNWTKNYKKKCSKGFIRLLCNALTHNFLFNLLAQHLKIMQTDCRSGDGWGGWEWRHRHILTTQRCGSSRQITK